MPPQQQYAGAVDPGQFEVITDYIVKHYFTHPSYWKIEGAPYFSIYELHTLVAGLGGIEVAKEALLRFRQKTKAAGFPDLHLNAIAYGIALLPGTSVSLSPETLTMQLGFSSVTSYTWIHHIDMPSFPATDYVYVAQKAAEHWEKARTQYALPYYPNVSMGWNSSPRTCQSDIFVKDSYPFIPVQTGNTPAAFQRAIERAKSFLDSSDSSFKNLNINAWNEWTEGSYLEPDTVNGDAYLDAIRTVFRS